MICNDSDQTARMCRLVSAFAGRTYNIVGNLMLPLICSVINLAGMDVLTFSYAGLVRIYIRLSTYMSVR